MLLGQSPEDNIDDLVKDRKVQDGVDKRSYQVSFKRIHKTLPEYKTQWNVAGRCPGFCIKDVV